MPGGVKDNDHRPRISHRIITCLSNRDDPVSINKTINLILSVSPDRDAEELIFHLRYLDETGRVMSYEETGLPTTIIKADWLAV